MANTVRDILVDIKSKDLIFSDKDKKSRVYYDVVWGVLFPNDGEDELFANIIIPPNKISKIGNDENTIFISAAYIPQDTSFKFRFVTYFGNGYAEISQNNCPFPVVSTAYTLNNGDHAISASELVTINSDGIFCVKFVDYNDNNRGYIYNGEKTDFTIGYSDNQSAQLLSYCGPGKYYKHPLSGIDIIKYINTVVEQTDFFSVASEQFNGNNTAIQEMGFDSATGDFQVVVSPEQYIDDEELLDVDQLDLSSLDITDEMLGGANLDDCDGDCYDGLIPDIEVPEIIASCFGNGAWMGRMPWTGDVKWKGQKTY